MNPKLISLVVVSGLLLPISGDYSLDSLRAEPAENEAEKPKPDKEFKPNIRVSKETTHVLGPLDKDGYVDFVEAVNERISKGVTPENNAAVPLLQAIGPECFAKELREEYFRRIGMKPLPEDGEYFVDFREFIKRNRQWLPPNLDADDENDTTQREEILEQQFEEAQTRPWSREEFPAIAAWLEANEKSLALVEKASRRSRYYVPLLRKGPKDLFFDVPLEHAQSLRHVARTLVVRAMLRLHEKELTRAWEELQICHRLARLSGQSATLVEFLISRNLEDIALSAEVVLVEYAPPNRQRAKAMIENLRDIPHSSEFLEIMDFAERLISLDAAQVTARFGPVDELLGPLAEKIIMGSWDSDYYDWNIVMKTCNGWHDRQVEALRIPSIAKRYKAMDSAREELTSVWSRSNPGRTLLKFVVMRASRNGRSQLLGDLYSLLILPATQVAPQFGDRITAKMKVTETVIALAAYKRERDNYPDKLSELAPNYLDKTPLDIFTGETLIYRKTDTGFILYSVGPNLQDDGGTSAEEADGYDFDLVVRVPSKRAAASE